MFAEYSTAAMELGEVLGLQGLTVPSPKEGELSLIKRASFTQAASYPSPFLDEQKMLRFAKAAHTLPSVSWRPLYQGFTNADSDPEPGRCRRTDGKKWRCSKEAMADHKYCERHINRNRHRSRKPVENQARKTLKETPAAASLPSPVRQGSFKKAKVNELKPGSVSYWPDSLNRTMLSKEKANKAAENNNTPMLQPTLSLFSQLKQQTKSDKFSPTVDSESLSSNATLKPWERIPQQSNKNISCTELSDRECLQPVVQNISLHKNENIRFQKNKDSNAIQVSTTLYSPPEGPRTSCLAPNMLQMQEDCISSSWEMPQGGPLGEILINSKTTEDMSKCDSRTYGWLLNLEDHANPTKMDSAAW